jgi:hypothetical protein
MKSNELSRHGRMSEWKSLAWMVLLRMWLTFSIVAFVLAVVFCVVERDNPLRSDDPYIPAGIVAAFCAGFALIYGVAQALSGSPIKQLAAYFGSVVGFSVFCIAVDFAAPSPEGQGILALFGVLIAVSGAATYPLLRIPLTKLCLVCASIPAVLYVFGYACAATSMWAHNR